MLFKPKFCCSCGTKIERVEWGVLTSRRFCEVCSVEHQKYDWFPRVTVAAGILFGVFGLGVWMGTPAQPQPLAASTTQSEPTRRPNTLVGRRPDVKPEDIQEPAPQNPGAALRSEVQPAPVPAGGQPPTLNKTPAPPVYYCGALTKKGTPCSRRVKVKGARCWQHTGQPAAAVSQSATDVY